MIKTINSLLEGFDIIFWDFDGVIKDSLEAKALAFEKLFSDCDKDIRKEIKIHHLHNGGLSRYEKIPIYLSWTGKPVNSVNVEKYLENFSSLVKSSVINSPWVPGVHHYLKSNYMNKIFIIITGTPEYEINEILNELGISSFFQMIFGSPISKIDALRDSIERFQGIHENAIMIGDSRIDYEAALENKILFALRRTHHNLFLQESLDCFKFKDFTNE